LRTQHITRADTVVQAELPNLRLSLSNRPENVSLVRDVLTGVAETIQLDEDSTYDIKAAVTEACNNVVLHAYEGGEGPLRVELYAPADRIVAVVRDCGKGIRPGVRSGEETGPGIGLRMIRALVSELEFDQDVEAGVSEGAGGSGVRMTFAAAGAQPLEPGRDAGVELSAAAPSEPASTVTLTLAPARLADRVLPRLVGLLAARADFSSDRIAEAQRIANVLAGYVRESSDGDQVSIGVTVHPRDLELRMAPLREVSEKELVADSGVDGQGEIAQLTKVEPEPSPDTLLLRLADRP
jgi:serine/threonine-protein kinase RsbW